MTERLFYDDAYLTRFRACVLEIVSYQGHCAVVLDQTAFYPTSGGQPFDRGNLGGANVVDVAVREDDDAVLHILDDAPAGQSSQILGEIDWERRFDHMQQHTGQHILSQAFVQVAEAETVSFHLGEEIATLDLASSHPLSLADMEQAEQVANRIVWEDRLVTARVVKPNNLAGLPLRKPPSVSGDVRLVQVEGFDWSACGGTHVARSGEIGLIKIIKWERRGDEMRVEFRCGRRALVDYAQKNSTVNRLAAGFNVGHWELDLAVERLVIETKTLRSRLRQVGQTLVGYRAGELRSNAASINGVRLVVYNLTEEPLLDVRELARQLVSEPGVIALLGLGDHKARLCFARSSNVNVDMVSLVRGAAGTLGSRGGGGAPDFAQGGGSLDHAGQLDTVLEWAAQITRKQLERVD